MALFSTETLKRKDTNMSSKERPYRVGRRIFENGLLKYGTADHVDREEAKRLDAEYGTNLVEPDEEPKMELPAVGDNKDAWLEYAHQVHGIDTTGMVKQTIIDTVYEREESTTEEKVYRITEVKQETTESNETPSPSEESVSPGESELVTEDDDDDDDEEEENGS